MRTPSLLLFACAAAIAINFTSSAQAVEVVVGTQVFGDDFPGTSLNAQWTPITAGSGAQVVVGTDYPSVTSAEIYSASALNRVAHIGTTSALSFAASPNDWWAQVTFLMPNHNGLWNSTNTTGGMYSILTGQQTNSPTVFGLVQGFDLRAIRVGPKLWSLGWYGDDDVFRTADILNDNGSSGYSFSDTQRYTVSMHRKSDDMVDIYFDNTAGDGSASNLIATKALILGANPDGMFSGDWSASTSAATAVAGYILIDKVNLGTGPGSNLDGDYNGDGSVDAADYVFWRKNDGSQEGYDLWATNFNPVLNEGGGSSLGQVSSTAPEPAAALLLTMGAAAWYIVVRRKSDRHVCTA